MSDANDNKITVLELRPCEWIPCPVCEGTGGCGFCFGAAIVPKNLEDILQPKQSEER